MCKGRGRRYLRATRECKTLHLHKGRHRKGKSIRATIAARMDMVCIYAPTLKGIMEMDREEVQEDRSLLLEIDRRFNSSSSSQVNRLSNIRY